MSLWKDVLGTNDYTDAGSAALQYASMKAKAFGGTVYMYGFDFDKADGPINNIYKNTDNYSTRLKQRKGVTSMFLETFNKFPKVKYVHVNTNMPELLEQYENVSWQT